MAGSPELKLVKNLIGITHFLMESARAIGRLKGDSEPSRLAWDGWRHDPSPFHDFLPLLAKGDFSMAAQKPYRVAMVGLGFGAEFIPIYQKHPLGQVEAICRRNESELHKVGDHFGIAKRYTEFDQVLEDPQIDFVHINSPIPDHAWMSLRALRAGKHVMCTVPMATTIEECDQICQTVADTGLRYMMAETVVYSREFLFLKEMYQKGELGKIQYMAASHPQDMDGWPEYWERMIPMHYATHVVSPVLGLVDGRAEYVSCFGSGTIRKELAEKSGNSYAVESCHIKIRNSDVAAHIWRFLFDTARQYRESFDVYGTKKSFEWSLVDTRWR